MKVVKQVKAYIRKIQGKRQLVKRHAQRYSRGRKPLRKATEYHKEIKERALPPEYGIPQHSDQGGIYGDDVDPAVWVRKEKSGLALVENDYFLSNPEFSNHEYEIRDKSGKILWRRGRQPRKWIAVLKEPRVIQTIHTNPNADAISRHVSELKFAQLVKEKQHKDEQDIKYGMRRIMGKRKSKRRRDAKRMELVRKEDTSKDAVSQFRNKGSLLFSNKENRDRAYKQLVDAGYQVRRTVHNNQLIHPEYIEDYSGNIETGYGNTMYRTGFSKLYVIDKKRHSGIFIDGKEI